MSVIYHGTGSEGEDRLPVEPVDPTTHVVFDLDHPGVIIDHGEPRAIQGRGLAILEVDGQHRTRVLLSPESEAFSFRTNILLHTGTNVNPFLEKNFFYFF